jgi:poly-gamma-glutamate synthesis protein (capsule biosynthesis protein)
MASGDLTLIFGGDTSIGLNCEWMFRGVDPLLADADLRMIQLEEPFLARATETVGPDRTTAALEPLKGRIDLVTLSGNHFYDLGEDGVRDTLDWCRRSGITCCGGGRDLAEAEKPAFAEKNGVRVGVLAWNAVGPKQSFAGARKGGTSFVDFTRAYVPAEPEDETRLENDVWALKKPFRLEGDYLGRNFPDPASLDRMAAQLAAAKAECDVLIAYFHKGYVHQIAALGDYERLLSHMAIDNGADAVIGTHSHILHGLEVYKGRAIYHGLNNFIMYTPQLSPRFTGKVADTATSRNAEWIAKRVERFGFVPDPDYPTYPFHPDSVYCACAKLLIRGGRIAEYRVVPMLVEKDGAPYVHGRDEKGRATADYPKRVTAEAGLNARLRWDGDELVVE